MVESNGLGVKAGEDWLFWGLDLGVDAGECAVVAGPNGSGKSTLLHCLYGAQPPSEGELKVCGRAPDERSNEFRRSVSALLDDSALFDELTPRQHLDLLLRSFSADDVDVDELLEAAGLDHRSVVPAGKLSAGQRRRLLLIGSVARP